MSSALSLWVSSSLEKTQTNKTTLAKFLGVNEATITRIISGKRSLKVQEIGEISRFLKVSVPLSVLYEINAVASLNVPIIGLVEPGVWRDPSEPGVVFVDDSTVPYLFRHDLPSVDQVAFRLVAPMYNNIFSYIQYVVCLRCSDIVPRNLDHGDIVVGHRMRKTYDISGGIEIETGIWRVVREGENLYVNPLFERYKNQLIRLSEGVDITHIVIGVHTSV